MMHRVFAWMSSNVQFAWLAGLVAAGLAAPAAAAPPAAQPDAAALQQAKATLTGTLRGGTRCGRKIGTEFKIEEVAAGPAGIGVKGSFQTTDMPGGDKTPHLETPFEGQFFPATGILQLHSVIIPYDPKACPKPLATVFGHKMECSVDFLGIIGEKLAEKRAKERAELAATSKFTAAFGRELAGDGWRGTIVNPAFDCSELALSQSGGTGPRNLPVISPDAAYAQASYMMNSGPPAVAGSAHVYWLKMAADQGHRDANAYLGRTYDLGEGAPQDFALAAKYYRVAAEAGDARAQTGLSKLLADGKGVPRNQAESEHWAALSTATRESAARICASGPAITTFSQLMLDSLSDPTAKIMEFLGGAFMGVDINPGGFRIISVTEQAVASVDRPFLCEAVARRFGATVTNIKPDFIEYQASNGDIYLKDQSFDAGMNRMLANGATAMMNAVPWVQPFHVEPQGGTRFEMTLQPQMIAFSRPYVAVVDISASATAVAAAPAPATTTATPTSRSVDTAAPVSRAAPRPAAALPAAAQAPAPQQAAGDSSQFDDMVNDAFVKWTSTWYRDRYKFGSAHAAKSECRPTGCTVAGTFSFTRGGALLTIPFSGRLSARGDDYQLTELCYNDTSTGQQDCM